MKTDRQKYLKTDPGAVPRVSFVSLFPSFDSGAGTALKTLLIAGSIATMSLPAAAAKYREYSNSTFDYAKVIDVVPVVETYQVNEPVEQCWDERVSRQDYRRNSKTPEILGAIIGGALGNQFGHGDGRKLATVAGAVLGTSVGRDVKHQQQPSRYSRNGYETVQRCELRDDFVTREQVVGFDVTYKYRGSVFHTQMNQHPGDKIKVKVTVNPV